MSVSDSNQNFSIFLFLVKSVSVYMDIPLRMSHLSVVSEGEAVK